MHDRTPLSPPAAPPAARSLRFPRTLRIPLLLAALAIPAARPAAAANATVPGTLSASATFVSAGFEWWITGDDDNDCTVTLEVRRPGGAWKPAQPLLRVEHGIWTHGEDPGNLLAGSLFFLRPGTAYEARLTLSDPDGGSAQQVVAFTTRAVPQATGGRRLYAIPGSGGGSGTASDPFRGLAAANAAAQPGDTIEVGAGTYAGKFTVTRDGTAAKPILYRGAGQASVTIDGGGGTSSTSNCVSLVGRKYVWIENMSLVNCLRPVLADSAVGCVIRGCRIQPIDQLLSTHGIHAAYARDLLIADNTVQMPGQWATIGRTGSYGTGGYAILIEGTGHVVCHNTVVESWDAISIPVTGTAVPACETSDVDVYGNFVDRASDDGIQADATQHNIRLFRNRLLNTGSAISFQPCFGGPAYVLYNEVFNNRIEPYKFHQETSYGWTQETSGFVVAHNTTFCSRNGWYESGIWRHGTFANNLLLGARSAPTLSCGYTYPWTRLDYDGYDRVGGYGTLVSFSGGSYANLAGFYGGTGNEQHGIEVTTGAFVNAPYPHDPQWDPANGYGWAYTTADYDLRLAAGSAAADKGVPLANVDDGFAGAAPDLGCYEAGAPLPTYGPRTSALGAIATADLPSGAAPLAVRFTGSAANALAREAGYRWDFGDGTPASDEQSPAHTYAQAGTYVATLTVTDEDGVVASATVRIQAQGATGVGPAAAGFEPARSQPDPFRGETTIRFALPAAGPVRLAVYDVRGARVRGLLDGERPAGEQTVRWDGRGDDGAIAPAGIYFLEMEYAGRS